MSAINTTDTVFSKDDGILRLYPREGNNFTGLAETANYYDVGEKGLLHEINTDYFASNPIWDGTKPGPTPPVETFKIKEFLVDDRYDDGWVQYGASATNGTIADGNWISDSTATWMHGLIKNSSIGVGSFLETKFSFSDGAYIPYFWIGLNSSTNSSKLYVHSWSGNNSWGVMDSTGNTPVSTSEFMGVGPHVLKIEIVESAVPEKVRARYSINGAVKYEEDVALTAFDSMYVISQSYNCDPNYVDYIKYKIA